MRANHTPTPWAVRKGPWKSQVFVVGGGQTIADISTYSDNEDGNAAFIVRACNCHEELVGAAEDALQSLKRLPDRAGAWRVTCIIQLEAALAKAKAKGQP